MFDYEMIPRERIASRVITHLKEMNITEKDTVPYSALFGDYGFYGYVIWFAKFVVISLSEELPYLPMKMCIFNFEVCSHLTKIFQFRKGRVKKIKSIL